MSHTKSIYKLHTNKAHAKFMAYTTYPPHLHKFFQCVYASPNRIGGFRVRDERRTLSALSTFSTLSILLSLSSECGVSVFIPAESLLSITEWSSESLMCLYFLTIEMFLANTFPSLFLPNNDCWPVHLGQGKQIIYPIACQFVLRTCMLD